MASFKFLEFHLCFFHPVIAAAKVRQTDLTAKAFATYFSAISS
jgi:hypothetical protein